MHIHTPGSRCKKPVGSDGEKEIDYQRAFKFSDPPFFINTSAP